MLDSKKKKFIKGQFITQAKYIFKHNTFEGYSENLGQKYKFIAPADVEYTYQWFWDTAFHAITISNFDLPWAKSEIRNYLKGQWDDGFMPHVVFWTANLANMPHWGFIESKSGFKDFVKKTIKLKHASLIPKTSALTQPPVMPIAVEEIYKKDPDKEFLKEVLPKFAQGLNWLLLNRDPDDDGLVTVISPNEAGLDELPAFQIVTKYLGLEPTKLRYTYRKIGRKYSNWQI